MRVFRRINDPPAARGGLDGLEMLTNAFDLAQDRVERVLERAIDGVSLCGLELVEVGFDSLARVSAALTVAALQVPCDLFPGEHGPSDLVDHRLRSTISAR